MSRFPLVMMSVLFLVWMAGRIVSEIRFDQEVGGHLKRAADASTPEIAKKELRSALSSAPKCADEDCYTSVIYRTPDEDVRFWLGNLNTALADLEMLPADAEHLTRSNALMKVREVLTDDGPNGVSVTVPTGISVYPNNGIYALWGAASFLGIVIIVGGMLIRD